MTRRAPAARCAWHFSFVRKMPVDSMTTSTPASPHADAAGSLTAVVRTRRPSTSRKLSCTVTVAVEASVDGVVLQQVRQVPQLEQVVDGDDLDVVAQKRGPEGHSPDPPESVDSDFEHGTVVARPAVGAKDNSIAISARPVAARRSRRAPIVEAGLVSGDAADRHVEHRRPVGGAGERERRARPGGLPASGRRPQRARRRDAPRSGAGAGCGRCRAPAPACPTWPSSAGARVDAAPAEHASVVSWLRRNHARIPRVVSICTGAFMLGAAGILDGRRATTHWLFLDRLRARFPGGAGGRRRRLREGRRRLDVGGRHRRHRPDAGAGRGGPRPPRRDGGRQADGVVPAPVRPAGAVQRGAAAAGKGAGPAARHLGVRASSIWTRSFRSRASPRRPR